MKKQFAIVVSEFNSTITDKLLEGALTRLQERGVKLEDIYVAKVPGAVEIPLIAKLLANTKKYQAIICLGAVIRGDTDHYDYVCDQVSMGCQKIMLDYDLPVIFGVLTTNNLQQALDRVGGKEGHKGIYSADAALHMSALVDELSVIARSAFRDEATQA
jgi:6,7-dimethyl-8-ribityllumazine synthase